MAVNRSGADVNQRPGDKVRFGGGASDVVKSAEKIDSQRDCAENGKHPDECEKLERSHEPSPGSHSGLISRHLCPRTRACPGARGCGATVGRFPVSIPCSAFICAT